MNEKSLGDIMAHMTIIILYFLYVWSTSVSFFFEDGQKVAIHNEITALTLFAIVGDAFLKHRQTYLGKTYKREPSEFLKRELRSIITIFLLALEWSNIF